MDNPENAALSERFDSFHDELKKTINTSITRGNAINMMAQHILTSPVFDALFEDYDFSSGNPVAIALNNLQKDFAEFGLENETRDLRGFYDSVRSRASGVKSSEGRQKVLSDLYEQFFKKALKKEAERLGIAYTPFQLVDFVLHSVNDVLQEEFGKTISDEGVHVLDPFTGTGTFIVQLLQSGLIQPEDLERKYRKELHANEILLLAYYIASVNIEEAFRGQHGEDNGYEPFEGIILTDTFNLNKSEKPTLFPKKRMIENNERAEHQQKLQIQVIVGNPPWSAGQKKATDDNPNVKYPELEQRITDTYADRTTTTLKRYLYDTYKMAIRWASDRIGEHYRDNTITKDNIFNYVYGILHAPNYKDQFANDLSKLLPHIPYAPDFHAFSEVGKALSELHLNYETCERYPYLEVEPVKPSLLWEEKPEHFLLGTRAMRFAEKNTKNTLIINEHICLTGIPDDAHHYLVDGRTPLEWFINRYKIKQDKNSGIINDPNGWFENPRDLITARERIVYVSVESTKIIESLPSEVTSI